MRQTIRQLLFGQTPFSPRNLFAAGEVGAWYEPGSLDTLYQTSTGTTPVTADAQPVGLLLDKSKGLALGSDGFADANITFTGESSRVSPGVYRLYSSAGSYSLINRISGTSIPAAGKTFLVTFTVDSVTTAGSGIQFEGVTSTPTLTSTTGLKSAYVVAAGSATLGIKRAGIAMDVQISNISVRELPGSHALQSSSTLRPTYKTSPNRLYFDADPDSLLITFPSAPGNSTLAYGVSGGEPVINYPVNISGTTYTIDPSVIGTFGPELVTNGGFDSDTVWNRGSGWSIGDGVATKTAGSSSYLSQTSSIPSGKTYKFEFTVSNRTAGNVGVRLENAASNLRSSNGTVVEYITSNSTNPRIILSADSIFNGSVDNVSVRELTGAAAQNTGLVIVNRALTAAETVKLTQYLKARS